MSIHFKKKCCFPIQTTTKIWYRIRMKKDHQDGCLFLRKDKNIEMILNFSVKDIGYQSQFLMNYWSCYKMIFGQLIQRIMF